MPLYDYQCPSCAIAFEMSRSRDEAGRPVSCPQCGAEAKRVYSSMGFVVKGGPGDYVPPPAPPGGHSHDGLGHGHSHGPSGHSH